MTLNVDLAPTILQAAGSSVPPKMQGRDLSPLYLQDSAHEWRQEYFYEHATIRDKTFIPASQALIRKDWKYIWWPEYEFEELFDLNQDPNEVNNLANDPAHAQSLEQLRASFQAARDQAR
jgi:arylsulfatase A-like enzyme